MTKMTHFSGDFQYEIAINFQKSIRKGVRLEHFDRFLMIFNENDHFGFVNTQIYHIYLALAMWFVMSGLYSEMVKKSIKYVQKMSHLKSKSALSIPRYIT